MVTCKLNSGTNNKVFSESQTKERSEGSTCGGVYKNSQCNYRIDRRERRAGDATSPFFWSDEGLSKVVRLYGRSAEIVPEAELLRRRFSRPGQVEAKSKPQQQSSRVHQQNRATPAAQSIFGRIRDVGLFLSV